MLTITLYEKTELEERVKRLEAAGDLIIENDRDYMFDDLFDYFG